MIRHAWPLLLLLSGCVVVSGPCRVGAADIVCTEGGKVSVFRPAHSIEVAGAVATDIAREIAADPKKIDPKLLVPPRERR